MPQEGGERKSLSLYIPLPQPSDMEVTFFLVTHWIHYSYHRTFESQNRGKSNLPHIRNLLISLRLQPKIVLESTLQVGPFALYL